MLKNSVYTKSIISFICVSFVISIFLFLIENAKKDANATEKAKYDEYKDTRQTLTDLKAKIGEYEDTLGQYFTIQTGIVNMLADNNEDMRDNVLSASSFEAALSSLAMQSLDMVDGVTLKNQLDTVNKEMAKFIQDNIVKIYERQGDQKTHTMMGFNQAFSQLVTQYNALDAEHTLKANKAIFGEATSDSGKADLYQTDLYKPMPTKESVFVTKCPNPSGNCYGYYEDANKDKRTCFEKHGTSGESNIVYWVCETDSETCTRAKQHWLLCPGVCGNEFAPKKVSRGQGNYDYFPNYPHQVKCDEDVYDGFWKFWAKCHGTYGDSSVWYTCERSSCPNASLHRDGSGSGSGSTSENTPSPSPTYHACGVHLTSVSGSHVAASCGTSGHYVCDGKDHSYVSCPKDSNNQACSYGSYYQCSPHTHAYPSVDNTPNCSDCTDGCSSCQATCASGHTYDPNNNVQYNSHRTRTCGFSECGQTWQGCGSGAPICNKPYRKQNDMNCQETD